MNILSAISLPLGIILLGFFVRRAGWFRSEADASLTTLTIRLLYPCFIVSSLTDHATLREPNLLLLAAPSVGFLSIIVGFALSALMARLGGLKKEDRGSFIFAAGIFNYGFFAFPVGETLFGEDFIGKLIVFNLGVEIAIWTVGVIVLVGGRPSWRRLINPPSISIICAGALTFLGGREAVPEFLFLIVDSLAACAIPLGLLLIGGSVSELWQERKPSDNLRPELCGVYTRLLIVPAIFLIAVAILPFDGQYKWIAEALVVQAAMPAGIFAIVVVKSFDCDESVALRVILATLLGCMLTMPAWLAIGIKLLPRS